MTRSQQAPWRPGQRRARRRSGVDRNWVPLGTAGRTSAAWRRLASPQDGCAPGLAGPTQACGEPWPAPAGVAARPCRNPWSRTAAAAQADQRQAGKRKRKRHRRRLKHSDCGAECALSETETRAVGNLRADPDANTAGGRIGQVENLKQTAEAGVLFQGHVVPFWIAVARGLLANTKRWRGQPWRLNFHLPNQQLRKACGSSAVRMRRAACRECQQRETCWHRRTHRTGSRSLGPPQPAPQRLCAAPCAGCESRSEARATVAGCKFFRRQTARQRLPYQAASADVTPGMACTSTAPQSAIASLPRIVRSLMKWN